MTTCVPVEPEEFRTLRQCIDGKWYVKKQQLFKCDDETTTWVDVGDWVEEENGTDIGPPRIK